MRFLRGTTSPSTLIMAVMSVLGWNLQQQQQQAHGTVVCLFFWCSRTTLCWQSQQAACSKLNGVAGQLVGSS